MKRKRKNLEIDYIGYFFIAPGYLVYLFFILIPILIGFYYSLTNYDFFKTMDFIGFNNYILLLGDKVFKQSVFNTFIYSCFTIIPQIFIGLVLAVLLNYRLYGVKLYRTLLYLPNVTSMVAISMIWLWIYDPSLGILNRLLIRLGMEPVQWLFNPNTAMGCVIVMSIWKAIGYNMVVYSAGLSGIPQNLYEAAIIDGTSALKQFIHITLPMLRPTTFFLVVTGTANSFMVFEQVNILTNGGPLKKTTTIVHQIYLRAFQDFRMGYASAMAMVLLVITLIVTLLNFRYGNQGTDIELG